MTNEEIIKFKLNVNNFTLEELKKEQQDIQASISKMILDSDLIIKAAIIETLINEKEAK